MAAVRDFGLGSRGRQLTALLAALVMAAAGATAWAFWTAGATAGSAGGGAAATVNQGATPTATLASSNSVTVTWGASTLTNGQAVDGYLVTRYDASSGTPQTSLPGCSGTIGVTSCTETGVPVGSWKYAITPVIGDHWRGPESLKSGALTVTGGAASLTVSPTTLAGPFPQTITGSLSGFGPHERISYRLDASTTLTGAPSQADASGNASVSIEIPDAGDGPHTVHADGTSSEAHADILIDTTAPTVTVALSPAANAAGWNNSSPVSVTLAADDGTGAGVGQIKHTTDGTDPSTSGTAQTYSGPFDVTAQGTTTVKFYGTDTVGNASYVQTQLVKIDTVAPTNSLSLNLSSGNALLSGSTLWYRGVDAGSFTLTNAVVDALSGPASSATAALSGDTGGWSHNSSLVSTPVGGPYVSNTFSWSAGTTSSPSESVTGRDVADNFTTAALSFANDSTGPTGGSVDATGLGGTAGRYSTSTTLSIAFSKGADAGVGLAPSGALFQREVGLLSSADGVADGTCAYSGGFATIATDPTSPYTDNAAGGISSGHCYKYQYVVADKLGNTTTYTSGDVKVETSAPPSLAPTPTLSNATGNTFVSGTTVYTNPQSGTSGSFHVSASPSDASSGIEKVSFPGLTGFTSPGDAVQEDTDSPYEATYSWSGAGAGASGSQTVTATDNASLTADASFTVTPDTTAPAGGSVDAAGLVGTGSRYSTSTSLLIALDRGADSGSGLAASGAQLQREQGTLASSNGQANGTCDYTGASFSAIATDPGSTYTDNAAGGISTGHCYKYQYVVSDRVGNTATYTSGDVRVDTTAPSAPSVSLSAATGNTFISGSTVYTNPQAGKSGGFTVGATTSDGDSGIQKVAFPSLTGFSSGGGDVTSSPYSTTYAWSGAGASASGSQTVTAFDNATLQATGSFTVAPDTNAPTGGSVDATGLVGTGSRYSASTTLSIAFGKGTDTGSGLATSGAQLLRASAPLSSSDGSANGSCGTYSAFTQFGSDDPSSPYTDNAAGGITTGNCYKYEYLVPDKVGNVATYVSGDVKVDTTPPTLVLSATGTNVSTNGTSVFFKSGSGSFTLTASDAQSGISSSSFAAAPTGWTRSISGNAAIYTLNGATASSTLGSSSGTNSATAVTTRASVAITLDTGAPTNSLTLDSASGAYMAAANGPLFYKNNAAGSFTLVNAVSDAASGPASATFPAIATSGWTHNAETVSTPAGGPFTSSTYSWTANPSAPGTTPRTFTSADAVGNVSVNTQLTFTVDNAAPVTGAVTVNGSAASAAGSTSVDIDGSFTIAGLTQYTDGGSGLKSSSLIREQAALSADGTGTCGTTWSNATTISANRTENSGTGIATGNCFRYTLTGTDNVGNTASISTIVKVDTTGPSAPALTITNSGSFAFVNGTTVYYNGTTGTSSSFTVSASTSDAESGIQKLNFPALASFTGGGDDTSSPYSATYTWTSSTDTGTKTVTASNGIGTTATSTFSLVRDVAAPTGGALTVNGVAATNGGSTSTASTTGFAIGARTDYAEAQSTSQAGLASSTLTIQSETVAADGTCGAPGSGGPFTSPTTISGTTQPSGIVAGFCYVYTLTGADNVGNTVSVKTTVIVADVFQVSNPGTQTQGTPFNVTITAIFDGATNTSYSGSKTITFTGPGNAPDGTAPVYPATVNFTGGVGTANITLFKAETTTLTATQGAITGTSASVTVNAGSAARLAWTNIVSSSATAVPASCLFTCSYVTFGNNNTFTAKVSVTDNHGNIVSDIGSGHTVSVTRGGDGGSFTAPTTGNPVNLTIASSGLASSTVTFTFQSQGGSWTSDTLTTQTTAGTSYTNATATLFKN